MKSLFKDALVLFAITLVAGLALGAVYEITADARAYQAELKQKNAYVAVFDGAEGYEEIDMKSAKFIDADLVAYQPKIDAALKKAGLGSAVAVVDGIAYLTSGDSTHGYVVTVTSKEGYGGDIQFSVGFSMDGKVTGISILSISETAGLGMKAKDKAFLNQYVGKSGGNFVVDKDNTSGLTNEIDAISSATITTRAFTKGVNAAYIAAAELAGWTGGDTDGK